ncbi:hypothetical protein QBC41DRAFT_395336 [Cercophora samala]|uniref:Uncharacterized protein n=1 Tax=Cercophora samala TaxID=330535 RepID=A0AA39ZC26_9PEZI|nr:hypothetical protein QBC41DRAFT_395336 [Cercophora samala]
MQFRHLTLLGALPLTLAHGPPSPSTPQITQLFAYPPTNPIFLENLLTLPDSRLLLSSFSPSLLVYSPGSSTAPAPIFTFPNSTAYTGITSLSPTTFAITGGIQVGLGFDPSTIAVHLFSLPNGSSNPTLIKSIPVPFPLPNGLLALPCNKTVLLAAESLTGSLLRIDTATNTVTTILQSALIAPNQNFFLGINGLAVRPGRHFDGYLYFTVSSQGYFGRIRISSQGYIPAGSEIEVLAQIQGQVSGGNAFDDLDFDHTGRSVYVAWQGRRVVKLTEPKTAGQPWSQQVIVDGTEAVGLKGVTAVKLGKGRGGNRVLFATTGGLDETNTQVGGQLVRIDL